MPRPSVLQRREQLSCSRSHSTHFHHKLSIVCAGQWYQYPGIASFHTASDQIYTASGNGLGTRLCITSSVWYQYPGIMMPRISIVVVCCGSILKVSSKAVCTGSLERYTRHHTVKMKKHY